MWRWLRSSKPRTVYQPPTFTTTAPAITTSLPVLARPPATLTNHASLPPGALNFDTPRIRIRHPGYADVDHNIGRSNIIFDHGRVDDGGVHYGTVLSMCYILSGNRPGYLSTHAGGAEPSMDFDDILRGSDYYFHVTDRPEENALGSPYSVCPSFMKWEFPHMRVPSEWSQAFTKLNALLPLVPTKMGPGVSARDSTCRISDAGDFCSNAHLVPFASGQWFVRNKMSFYSINASQNATPVDDIRNGIWLRNDIHQAFDAKLFTLTVKNQKPVVHFMAPTYGLGGMYHNCELRLSYDAVAAFFFARFAWSIFPMAQRFVERPGVRTTDKSYEQQLPTFPGAEAPYPVDAAAADETLEYDVEEDATYAAKEYDSLSPLDPLPSPLAHPDPALAVVPQHSVTRVTGRVLPGRVRPRALVRYAPSSGSSPTPDMTPESTLAPQGNNYLPNHQDMDEYSFAFVPHDDRGFPEALPAELKALPIDDDGLQVLQKQRVHYGEELTKIRKLLRDAKLRRDQSKAGSTGRTEADRKVKQITRLLAVTERKLKLINDEHARRKNERAVQKKDEAKEKKEEAKERRRKEREKEKEKEREREKAATENTNASASADQTGQTVAVATDAANVEKEDSRTGKSESK